MSVSMLQIKKMLPKPTKSRMSEKYKDGLRQSWGASTDNEETMGFISLPMNQDQREQTVFIFCQLVFWRFKQNIIVQC